MVKSLSTLQLMLEGVEVAEHLEGRWRLSLFHVVLLVEQLPLPEPNWVFGGQTKAFLASLEGLSRKTFRSRERSSG